MQSDECRVKSRAGDNCGLEVRTKRFALQIIRLYQQLPHSGEAQVVGKQLLRSGTSVGAQYREAMRSRSKAEFHSKIQSALQEMEESGYWIDLLIEAHIMTRQDLALLCAEQKELTAMLAASAIKTKPS